MVRTRINNSDLDPTIGFYIKKLVFFSFKLEINLRFFKDIFFTCKFKKYR